MHWFWRAAIAVVVSFLIFTGISIILPRALPLAYFRSIPLQISLSVARYAMPLIIFGLLTLWWASDDVPRETRCRKCGYILRGISEPRCPECGERI